MSFLRKYWYLVLAWTIFCFWAAIHYTIFPILRCGETVCIIGFAFIP